MITAFMVAVTVTILIIALFAGAYYGIGWLMSHDDPSTYEDEEKP